MIKKTKDYDMFVFRADNREKIDHTHVKKLQESIQSRNMLQLAPIIVNDKMEVIDGQHRLLAAKALGVEIFYREEKKMDCADIIRMNISKSWRAADYLNFYCQHNYEEYKKLATFMKKNNVSLKVAMTIGMGQAHLVFEDFRMGNFKFPDECLDMELDICWDTINYIKKINGFSPYTSASRFWKAMLKLFKHPDFDANKWRSNMKQMIDNFAAKAKHEHYVHMFEHIYNWRNTKKIKLTDKEV